MSATLAKGQNGPLATNDVVISVQLSAPADLSALLVTESGKVDGAGDFRIFLRLVLPMMKPALATTGLFLALGYWNEWYLSSLYLGSTVEFKPLQYYLYNIINTANALKSSMAGNNVTITQLPTNTLKMASAVVATGPIVLLYPFVQRYFVSGITVGAVKG